MILVFSALAVAEFQGALNTKPPLTSVQEDFSTPECFPKDFYWKEPIINDCLAVGRQYKADEYYSDNITYTRDRRRAGQQADRAVPLYFRQNTCLLYVDAKPMTRDQKFSLKSQWPRISELFKKCLFEAKPGHKYGGFVRLASPQTGAGFIACIGARPKAATSPCVEIGDGITTTVLETNVTIPKVSSASPVASSPVQVALPEPECFSPEGLSGEPALDECIDAAKLLKADPFYSRNVSYHRARDAEDVEAGGPGSISRATPVIFQVGECALFLDALPRTRDESLKLEDHWSQVSLLYKKCLYERKPGHRFGGKISIGDQRGGFYFCVGAVGSGVILRHDSAANMALLTATNMSIDYNFSSPSESSSAALPAFSDQ